jgi:deazaflavin-dependent oxidoreductase (nitroreductase family)
MTFTGRKTGQAFTTPVSYVEFDGEIAITCHRTRQWWRNLAANPDVGLRLAGHERRGIATVLDDPDDAFDVFVKLLKAQPAVARVSDIPLDAHGMPDPVKTREVLAYTMVVTIKLEEV